MRYTYAILLVLLICAAVALAGCTGTTGPSGATGSISSGSSTSGSNLVISPTDVVPENNRVTVTVQEKVYDGTIPVVFNGGKGQALVKTVDVTLYRSDGQVKTAMIGINKDDSVILQGTKDPNNPDRVVVYVSEMNGERYKVADVLVTYRQH